MSSNVNTENYGKLTTIRPHYQLLTLLTEKKTSQAKCLFFRFFEAFNNQLIRMVY